MDTRLPAILELDAGANAAGGLVLLVAAHGLAGPLGLAGAVGLRVCGAVLVGYAAQNLFVARRPTPTGLLPLAGVDVAFSVALFVLALANPTGAATWARWVLAVIAALSLGMGAIKLVGRRRLQ